MRLKRNVPADNARSDRVYRVVAYTLLTLIMITICYPVWVILAASLSDPRELYTKTFILWPTNMTLESYQLVFRDQSFLNGIWNSVQYTVVGTFVNVLMNICGAYPLSKTRLKGKTALTFLFTFTMFFSGGIVPTYILINSLGLLDHFWVMILPSAVGTFNIIIMRTYFQASIPQELEDAASVDGCTNFRYLLRVVLPLSGPIVCVIALYYGVARWNDYFTAMMYLTKSSKYPLQLVLRDILIQNQASKMLNVATDAGYADRMISRMGLKYAVIVISTLPILIIYPFVQRFFSKGVMIGAIKG
jgi:putative aldouronate transport system permease protein